MGKLRHAQVKAFAQGHMTMCQGSQDHPQVQGFPRRTQSTAHIAVLRLMCDRERCRAESAKGRGAWSKSPEETRCELIRVSGVTGDMLNFSAMSYDDTCEMSAKEAH